MFDTAMFDTALLYSLLEKKSTCTKEESGRDQPLFPKGTHNCASEAFPVLTTMKLAASFLVFLSQELDVWLQFYF